MMSCHEGGATISLILMLMHIMRKLAEGGPSVNSAIQTLEGLVSISSLVGESGSGGLNPHQAAIFL